MSVVRRLCRSLARVAHCALLAASCGGCSLSFPLSPMVESKDEVTGSLKPVIGKLADEEDRRRAKAALSTAMDPQGDGTAVAWENPTTGNKGSFTAVGHAYPLDSRICRAFLENLHHDGDDKAIQGTACTVSAGEWGITDTKPFKKS